MSTSKPEEQEISDKIIRYGQSLTSVLRAFDVLEAEASWFERQLIRLLRVTYRQWLRHLVMLLPSEIVDKIIK